MSRGLKSGDIVRIPLPNGRTSTGWIIYISNSFKDLIGVLIYGFDNVEVSCIGSATPKSSPIYTSLVAARYYGWVTIGQRPVDRTTFQMTERIVGGEVFVGDECIRLATDEDRKLLPKMLAKGMPVVQDELEVMASKLT